VQNLFVGIRKLKPIQIIQFDPLKCRTAKWLRLTCGPPALKEIEANGFFRVTMNHRIDPLPHFNFDCQFLAKFPDQALLEGFIAFAFSARKLPESAQMRISVSLCDEKFSVPKNQAGGNVDDLLRIVIHSEPERTRTLKPGPHVRSAGFYRPMLL
jgi:hypothetical protein